MGTSELLHRVFLGTASIVYATGLAASEVAPGSGATAESVATAVSVADTSQNAFGRALGNLDPADWPRVQAGKRVFVRVWSPPAGGHLDEPGLGPLFNADSCAGCHFKDGRGGRRSTADQPPIVIARLDAGDPAHDWGGQLQDRAVSGLPEGLLDVTWEEVRGHYADGEPYRLRRPLYRVVGAVSKPRLSPRIPPILVGVGLLEAVDDEAILASADPDDRDRDGISGRASWPAGATAPVGRFGWKAGRTNLMAQAAGALAEDMGVATNSVAPEIDPADLAALVDYLRLLAPPAQRAQHRSFSRGRSLFERIGCAACHRMSLPTASAEAIEGLPVLADLVIEPFTDLLLHDLGEGLADDGVDGAHAAATEWRTAPLWGLGLMETVNGGLYLLHDGRARSFAEAILWHGGEARASSQRFRKLPSADRDALVVFLEGI